MHTGASFLCMVSGHAPNRVAATTFGRLPTSAGSDRLACRLVQGDALFELGDYHGAELAYTEALQLMPQGDERRPATADRLAAIEAHLPA